MRCVLIEQLAKQKLYLHGCLYRWPRPAEIAMYNLLQKIYVKISERSTKVDINTDSFVIQHWSNPMKGGLSTAVEMKYWPVDCVEMWHHWTQTSVCNYTFFYFIRIKMLTNWSQWYMIWIFNFGHAAKPMPSNYINTSEVDSRVTSSECIT
jgi:hypothetical protein